MPSDAVVNALGALGGGVLAGCLAPQLYKLWATQSARDLSYLFLALYNLGLTLTFVYLFFEDALVAWICLLIELAFGCLMVAAKVYLDNFGPNSPRGLKRARPEAKLTNSLSFASEVRIDVKDFAAGKVAPFPLLTPAPTHAAQHLLLDAQLCLPASQPAAAAPVARTATNAGCDAASKESDEDRRQVAGGAAARVLPAVGDMLEAALAAAGLPVQRRQAQAFPSFRRQSGSSDGGGFAGAPPAAKGAEEAAPPDMLYFACRDGYCTAIWYCSTATLSIDLLAASNAAVACMGDAAHQLCEQLLAQWPGSRIAASSVSRLPRAA